MRIFSEGRFLIYAFLGIERGGDRRVEREGTRSVSELTSPDLLLHVLPASIVAISVAAAALQFLLTVRC